MTKNNRNFSLACVSLTLWFSGLGVCLLGCEKTDQGTASQPDAMAQLMAEDMGVSPVERPMLGDDALGIPADDFFPEGITRSEAGDVYIGSVNTGSIVVVRQGEQWAQELIPGDRLEGAGTAGLLADSVRGALWACTGDFFGQVPSRIWRFDLESGETQGQHELPGRSFCNDLALDDQGRVYATDSFGGRIFRIDDETLALWLEGMAYEPVDNSPLSLNGIAWDPAGKLWFGRTDTGQLSYVEVNADGSPGDVHLDLLALPEEMPIQGIDGLKWRSPGEFIAVRGRMVYQLLRPADAESGESWEMNLIDDTLNHATTFAFDEAKTSAWVVESQLSKLYQGSPPDLPFQVRRIPLPAIQSE